MPISDPRYRYFYPYYTPMKILILLHSDHGIRLSYATEIGMESVDSDYMVYSCRHLSFIGYSTFSGISRLHC